MHIAAENGNTPRVKSLLNAGADPNALDKIESTPLHLAAWKGYTDTIKVLLNGGADANAKNKYGWIPLHSASQNGCIDTIDILIIAGADLTAKIDGRWTPLRIALQNRYYAETRAALPADDCRRAHLRALVAQYYAAADLLTKKMRLLSNIAFIGNIGVGKSTAISSIFDLLVPLSSSKKTIERTALETGGGGTTICEVQIKEGLEIEISLLPMSDAEMRDLVSAFCAAKWSATHKAEKSEVDEKINVSSEQERAIRNMSGLLERKIVDGKPGYKDPVADLVNSSGSEEELKIRVLALMNLKNRIRRKLRYDRSIHPMEWIKKTFEDVNNGRIKDVPLPKIIRLFIPGFGRAFGEMDITVIDTEGVDEIEVREDLDQRLKDPWTAIVICSRFNDAPGNSTRILLKYMRDLLRENFSEHIDNGKVSLMVLPRPDEARVMKRPDTDEPVESDDEGYELKRMQILPEFEAEDLADFPILFYNVEVDDASAIRSKLLDQLNKMRKAVGYRNY